jgi:hypothetical protein
MIYLRTFPPQGSLLNIGFNAIIPFAATQGVSIFFSVSKTVLLDRDALTINGNDCVNTTFAAKELNTLAYFIFDNNRNSVSDYTSVPLFAGVQSLKAWISVCLQTDFPPMNLMAELCILTTGLLLPKA